MTYKYFQERHPEWSRRLKDVIGRKVSLKKDSFTNGKKFYKMGTVFIIESTWRGKLHLITPQGGRLRNRRDETIMDSEITNGL